MIIVGELINASWKVVATAIESKDKPTIHKLAKDQEAAGANYIDINAGIFGKQEGEYLKWLVESVQEVVGIPCCIDSPAPDVVEIALSVRQGTAMVNSISLEKDRREKLLPIIAGSDLKVVALCMSNTGMPKTAKESLKIADELISLLVKNNIKLENIYVDPLVQPVATDQICGREFLEAIDEIMTRFEGIHTICGLSNISFGLPARKLLNKTFVTMAIARGLDATIINPLDQSMMANIIAAEALAGRDEFSESYLKAYRENRI